MELNKGTPIEELILTNSLVKAIFSGKNRSPWKKIAIRPVLIKNRKMMQVSMFDDRRDITKNYNLHRFEKELNKVVRMEFSEINIQTEDTNYHYVNQKLSSKKVSQQKADLAHDSQRKYILDRNTHEDFLIKINLLSMKDKHEQVDRFLHILEDLPQLQTKDSLNIVDFGCGNAYLTFAVYYYFVIIKKTRVNMIGVDLRKEFIQKHTKTARELGFKNIKFLQGQIIDTKIPFKPNLVLALHACDTATDEALYQAITLNTDILLSSPCCHHNVQMQLEENKSPELFSLIYRQGILLERFGDVLTDSLRAALLRIKGYKTDVFEFTTTEHTAKNLLIRAVKTEQEAPHDFVQKYKELKEFFKVKPYLEKLLNESF